jgi:hypothetical protein
MLHTRTPSFSFFSTRFLAVQARLLKVREREREDGKSCRKRKKKKFYSHLKCNNVSCEGKENFAGCDSRSCVGNAVRLSLRSDPFEKDTFLLLSLLLLLLMLL